EATSMISTASRQASRARSAVAMRRRCRQFRCSTACETSQALTIRCCAQLGKGCRRLRAHPTLRRGRLWLTAVTGGLARLLRSLLFATALTLSSCSLTDGEAVSADLVKPTVAAVLAILLLKERITIGMATSLGLRFVVSMHRS